MFPPGGFPAYTPTANTGNNAAPAPMPGCLPFLEQQSLYNALNWSLTVINDPAPVTGYGPYANSTVTITRLNAFLCPSDTPPSWNLTSASAPLPNYRAPGQQLFRQRRSSLEFASRQTGGPPNGPFSYIGEIGRTVGIRDVTDGTSNTIAFGEWTIGDGNSNLVSIPSDVVFIGSLPSGTARNNGTLTMPNPILVANFPAWVQSCSAASDDGPDEPHQCPGRGLDLRHHGRELRQCLAAAQPEIPQLRLVHRGKQHPAEPRACGGLASYHSGGANVVLLDGSVRFLKDSISQQTLWALGSIAQGEIVSSDSY